jgi:hypothetical protein
VSLTPRDAPLTGRWDEHAELAAVDPSWPARVQAYEDALRNIAAIVVRTRRRTNSMGIPAPSAAGDMLTGVESQLAALVALGYTPQPDTTGRRPLTAPESPR